MKDTTSLKVMGEEAFKRSREVGVKGPVYNILRWCGIILAKILLYTPITANQVSVLSSLVIYVSALFFAVGKVGYSVIAIALLYLGQVLDEADGSVARARKEVTILQSTFVCKLYHAFSLPIVFIGIGFGVYQNTGNIIYLLLGFSASFFQLNISGVEYLKALIRQKYLAQKKLNKGAEVKPKGLAALVGSLVHMPLEYLKEIIIVALLFNKFTWLLIFYGIFTPIKLLLYLFSTFMNLKKTETKLKIKF